VAPPPAPAVPAVVPLPAVPDVVPLPAVPAVVPEPAVPAAVPLPAVPAVVAPASPEPAWPEPAVPAVVPLPAVPAVVEPEPALPALVPVPPGPFDEPPHASHPTRHTESARSRCERAGMETSFAGDAKLPRRYQAAALGWRRNRRAHAQGCRPSGDDVRMAPLVDLRGAPTPPAATPRLFDESGQQPFFEETAAFTAAVSALLV
jgi:hypothetical protein